MNMTHEEFRKLYPEKYEEIFGNKTCETETKQQESSEIEKLKLERMRLDVEIRKQRLENERRKAREQESKQQKQQHSTIDIILENEIKENCAKKPNPKKVGVASGFISIVTIILLTILVTI